MKQPIPEALREQMRRAGRARAAKMTREERAKGGRMSWKNRLARAQQRRAFLDKAEGKPAPQPATAPTFPPQD